MAKYGLGKVIFKNIFLPNYLNLCSTYSNVDKNQQLLFRDV